MTPRLQHYAELAIGLAIVAFTWWHFTPPPAPPGEWTAPKTDARLKGFGSHTVPASGVVVVDDGAKDKLDLPDPVKQDPKKHVTSAVIIQSDERPQSVVSIFDEATGQTDTLTQRMAYPLLATEQRGRFGVGGGFKSGKQVGHVYLGETLLQIKGWHAGGAVHLFTDGSHLEELVVEYRW